MNGIRDKWKLIAVTSALLVTGFCATSFLSYHVAHVSIREGIVGNQLPITSDTVYSEIQRDLILPVIVSSMMAKDTFLRDWMLSGEQPVEAVIKYLREVKQRYGAVTSFFVSDRTRNYYQPDVAGGILKQVSPTEPRDVWYYRVRNLKSDYEINVDVDLANHDAMTIFINYRAHDYAGKFIGATGVGLTVEAVRKLIDRYQREYGRLIYFVDKTGRIMLRGDQVRVPEANIHEREGLRELAARVLKEERGSYQYAYRGRTQLLNVRPVAEFGWYLFVEQEEDAALENIRRSLYASLAVWIGVTLLVLLATTLTINRYQSRLEVMATTDKLTGLSNRQAHEIHLHQALKEAVRSGHSLSLMMLDLDRFKSINDCFGHQAGDQIICAVARILGAGLRSSDIISRWGGDEYLVILKDCALADAQRLADKIRVEVERQPIDCQGRPLTVTVSIGVAELVPGDDGERLLARVDEALYAAKNAGRNRVCVQCDEAEEKTGNA